MPKVRVLVVDDSVVYRRLVSEVLEEDGFDVVGRAANGRIALQCLDQLNPDLVILDVEMPVLDGLQTLRALRASRPDLPVVMFSALTERGARSTLDALAAGASDYASKPDRSRDAQEGRERIRAELLPKVRALCCPRHHLSSPLPARRTRPPRGRTPQRVDVVVIGVSTGGPKALTEVIPRLPADFPVPLLIVQHMPPLFTRLLAERLSGRSAIDLAEGRRGAMLRAGHGWIAPGDHHMRVRGAPGQAWIDLDQGPPESSCRPAADPLFRSAVEVYGSRVLAVVLTGMGRDGLNGCQHVREAGGAVLVQDEASSVVWGMPGFVARAGLADEVLPLHALADAIAHRARVGRALSRQGARG